MKVVNPYLHFLGTAEEAFRFYQSVFGGEFVALQRFGDTPHGAHMAPEDASKIMHVALPLGAGNILMGSDAPESMKYSAVVGTNFSLSINTESREEADRLFGGLSSGGTVTMPLADVFWGDYFGMCTDRFGVQWMVSFNAAG